jgi:hypothetical protein
MDNFQMLYHFFDINPNGENQENINAMAEGITLLQRIAHILEVCSVLLSVSYSLLIIIVKVIPLQTTPQSNTLLFFLGLFR